MSLLGSVFGFIGAKKAAKAEKKADAKAQQIALQNMEEQRKRFDTGRSDSLMDYFNRFQETKGINDDMDKQLEFIRGDTRDRRASADKQYGRTVQDLLASFGNEGDLDVGQTQQFHDVAVDPLDTAGIDEAVSAIGDTSGDTELNQGLAARGLSRTRQAEDATAAGSELRRLTSEAQSPTVSAADLAAILGNAGRGAIGKSFDKSRGTAALELSRTGGDPSAAYTAMAREQSDALKQNDIEAILQGLSGAEGIAGAKASRLSPQINAASARFTATPDVSAEASAAGMRSNRTAQAGMYKQQAMSSAKDTRFKNLLAQAGARNQFESDNTARLTANANRRGQFRTSRSGALAAIAPLGMESSRMAMPGAERKIGAGGMNFSYLGSPVPQNGYDSKPLYGNARVWEGVGNAVNSASKDILGFLKGF